MHLKIFSVLIGRFVRSPVYGGVYFCVLLTIVSMNLEMSRMMMLFMTRAETTIPHNPLTSPCVPCCHDIVMFMSSHKGAVWWAVTVT